MTFMTAMTAHDALPGQAPTADKVMAHLQYALQFCWAAHKKLIPALCYTADSHDARISDWAAALHTENIMPVKMNMQTGLVPPDAIMPGMTSSLVTLMETMTVSYLLAAVRDEKKTNGFEKLGACHLRIIMNASTDSTHPITHCIP
jgi:hypothetical protein